MVSALGGEPIPRPGLLPRTICWQTLEFLGPQSPTLWAQRCLCGVKEGGREQAVLASGKMSGESGLLTCPSLPSSPPCPGVSVSFLTPSTTSSLASSHIPPIVIPAFYQLSSHHLLSLDARAPFKGFLSSKHSILTKKKKKKVTEEQRHSQHTS